MRLDQESTKSKQRERQLRQRVSSSISNVAGEPEPKRASYYRTAEDCGHLAHVTDIVNERCPRCVNLTYRDGNGNLVA